MNILNVKQYQLHFYTPFSNSEKYFSVICLLDWHFLYLIFTITINALKNKTIFQEKKS